ncbi:MAG: DegT/DnrJ/EryC1/StrS family aminotransferase [Deltaproteobacteria bacterium]|nr:DegT/DnrJ/EryC1/StrS family aminotransferase [Deltaproteobacteria bacterium]
MERGAFILQQEIDEFENAVKEFVGAKHCVGVANGTDSLYLALLAVNVAPGDEVIMASHTYIATAAAAHFAGAKPVLVECLPDRTVDPEAVEAAITSRTRVIMPTQLNGRTAKMDALQDIADRHGLVIIEDAAQALGSKFKGQCAGTFGSAGSISLYPAKVLGCFGDGGLLFTDDDEMYERLYEMRDHGRNSDGQVVRWGINSRLDNIQAAVLLVKLKHYPEEIDRRRQIARLYQERLCEIEDMTLPPGPDEEGPHFDIYQNYEVEAGRRDELRGFLDEHGVGTIIQWNGTPVHQFKGLSLPAYHLPKTDRFFERCFLLPMNTSLADDDVHYVCDCIVKFYRG